MAENDTQSQRRTFQDDITRGREFERRVKADWKNLKDGVARFEAPTKYKGKKGRIDILIEELGDYVSIVEVKATDWDRVAPHRVRPNALRHARQIWRYIDKEVDEGQGVCPGIIYPSPPTDLKVKLQVEEILNDRGIQVVWQDE